MFALECRGRARVLGPWLFAAFLGMNSPFPVWFLLGIGGLRLGWGFLLAVGCWVGRGPRVLGVGVGVGLGLGDGNCLVLVVGRGLLCYSVLTRLRGWISVSCLCSYFGDW